MQRKVTLLPLFFIGLLILLTSCASGIDGARYADDLPRLDLYRFFHGNVKAWGIVQNRKGEVVQRFTADIVGSIDNGSLILDETFSYQLGEGMKRRIWTIQQTDNARLTGQAGDIIGSATGSSYGNALNWQYQMDLTVKQGTFRVKFDDWMWQLDNDTLINRAYIRKFGLTMAEVTLFMQRQSGT